MATAPQAARPAATRFGTASHRPKMPPQISSTVDTIYSVLINATRSAF